MLSLPPPPPQPVRAELMQALWSTLHNPYDNVATVAYRVLGKFGGSNRKMLSTPQPVSQKNKHQLLISYFSKEILHLNTLYWIMGNFWQWSSHVHVHVYTTNGSRMCVYSSSVEYLLNIGWSSRIQLLSLFKDLQYMYIYMCKYMYIHIHEHVCTCMYMCMQL